MYLSLKWIEQLYGFQNIPLKFLTKRLILSGFEIESIENKKTNENLDIILDISLTANRSELTNLKGLFFELSSLFKEECRFQKSYRLKTLIFVENNNHRNEKSKLFFKSNSSTKQKQLSNIRDIKNLSTRSSSVKNILYKYLAWEQFLQRKELLLQPKVNSDLTNSFIPITQAKSNFIKIAKSPPWIRNRLFLMKFKPINNVIDIIHYILIETGQVFFVYDLNYLENYVKSKNLEFALKFPKQYEKFSLTKNNTITLNSQIMTLSINQKVISILGFIQDYKTIVNDKTSQLLLDFSIYNNAEIKRLSKNLNIRTEYSIKLEKQIDLNLIEQAYHRLIYLFRTQGITFENSKVDKLSEKVEIVPLIAYYVKKAKLKINVCYKHIDRLLGPYKYSKKIERDKILNILRSLYFKISFKTNKNFFIKVPIQRQLDIEEETDIIEEIVRMIGFHSFQATLPHRKHSGELTKLEKLKRHLKNSMITLGMSEGLHSILSKKTSSCEIVIQNPLFNESAVLRSSLLRSLLEKISFNKNTASESFELFEVGRIYKSLNKVSSKKKELELISGIFGGKLLRTNWDEATSMINWFEAKGVLENIFSKLELTITWVPAHFKVMTYYHPTRTANLFIDSHFIGTFGQIHPTLAIKERFIKELYLFELNLERITSFWKTKSLIEYQPYSLYPISYLDLTCIVNKNLSFKIIRENIFFLGDPLIFSIELSDYYSKPPIKKGFYSLTFKLGFRSKTKTLLTSEINSLFQVITSGLKKNFDIEFK